MKKYQYGLFWRCMIGILLLAGCGQLEFGIESPVPESATVATEAVGQMLAVPTRDGGTPTLRPPVQPTAVASQSAAPTSTPTREPAPTSTPTPPPPVPTNTRVPTATSEPRPEIYRFSVVPQTVQPGARLQLSWEADGERAEICLFQTGYNRYRECRETAVAGALEWELDDALRDDFAVELTVNRGEQVAVQGLSVTVTCTAASDWWFFTPAPAGCPAANAVTTQAAAQIFEHGWMLWLESEDVIYAFFDDNTFARFFGDQLWGDVTTGDGGVVAPAGRVAPVRGFGLVWRGEADGAEDGWVGDKIGWGLSAESGFQTEYQWDAHADFLDVYVRDANSRIIYIDPSLAGWAVYQEPD